MLKRAKSTAGSRRENRRITVAPLCFEEEEKRIPGYCLARLQRGLKAWSVADLRPLDNGN